MITLETILGNLELECFFLWWRVPWLLFEFVGLIESTVCYQLAGLSQSAEKPGTGRDAWAALDPYDLFRVVFV